jgi:hypothetical protein
MAEKTLNTIIVLRNDKSTDWANSEVILKEGELGVSYLENGNVMVKAGNGVDKWADLSQVESVLEKDMMLTYSFGKHSVPTGGSLNAGGTNMTMSQWIADALKKTVEPTIVQPSASLSASPSGDTIYYNSTAKQYYGEIGDKINKLNWDGSTSNGSYKVGSGSDQGTGISSSNFTWAVSNTVDSQTSASIDGNFPLTTDKYIQINSESDAIYATINATVTLDASNAKTPKNNLGEDTSGKITATTAGSPWSKSASVKATGYRKPFWGIKTVAQAIDVDNITSAQVRALGNSGNVTKGLPTTTAASPFVVPAGSQQVFFLAKAGTYTSLSATDAAAMNAGVTFTKVANAVNVEGANGYTATAYDMFFVDWGAGIDADKKLVLTWK